MTSFSSQCDFANAKKGFHIEITKARILVVVRFLCESLQIDKNSLQKQCKLSIFFNNASPQSHECAFFQTNETNSQLMKIGRIICVTSNLLWKVFGYNNSVEYLYVLFVSIISVIARALSN